MGCRPSSDPALLWLWCRLAAKAPDLTPSLLTSICSRYRKKKKSPPCLFGTVFRILGETASPGYNPQVGSNKIFHVFFKLTIDFFFFFPSPRTSPNMPGVVTKVVVFPLRAGLGARTSFPPQAISCQSPC